MNVPPPALLDRLALTRSMLRLRVGVEIRLIKVHEVRVGGARKLKAANSRQATPFIN